MAERSGIEWTDHTFNPWIGCTKVSPACRHCYAERSAKRMQVEWGAGQARKRTSASYWREPLKWNARAERTGQRERVFCASLADVFDNEVDPIWRADLFRLIFNTPHLDWLLLTKRIGNARRELQASDGAPSSDGKWTWPWPNIWLGITVVNQEEADRDVPKLLDTPARVRFLSMEPLLEPVDLRQWLNRGDAGLRAVDPLAAVLLGQGEEDGSAWVRPALDWVIAGGESGPHARPMHPDWARSLRDQCTAAGVPFFFKQWGEWRHTEDWDQSDGLYTDDLSEPRFMGLAIDRAGNASPIAAELPDEHARSITQVYRMGKKMAGRRLDGRTWDEVPV